MYRERKLGTDDYARDAKRVRDNAIEWIKRAQSKRLGGLRKAPQFGGLLASIADVFLLRPADALLLRR